MYRAEFVGRSRELEVLDRLWQSPNAALLILYGRRRVGKTRLLTHWLREKPGQGLYWVAEPTSSLSQLRSFSQAIMSFMDPEADIPPDFTFASWELALRQVARYAQDKPVALFIDEVTYLIDVDPDFVGMLQKIWDHWLSDANMMLALSGSQMGIMRRNLLNYDAPLYGRATAQSQLPPLPFGTTGQFFPGYGAAERVALYAMWGGVPAYWERLDADQSVLGNLRQTVLPNHSWMVDESRILLSDFITDMHNYVGILRAIADGEQTMGEISKRTGLSSGKASFYLSVLRDTGFVTREVPVSHRNREDSRSGRYVVTDPYLRFFYRFISSNQSKLALGQIQPLLDEIEAGLPAFIGANTWPELCRQWLLLASANGEIPVPVDVAGSEWASGYTVDVVGASDGAAALVLGDCFWQEEPVGIEAVEALIKKVSQALPKHESSDEDDADEESGPGPWSVYLTGFSKSGWTAEAQESAERLAQQAAARSRKRWVSAGVRLLDLATVDEDLAKWSV
jgi:AAA+ ATPase superfamily predicted ATPase